MSYLYFPNVYRGSEKNDIHIYIFPTILYEPTKEELSNAFECFLSNFDYPEKFKAQILFSSEHTEKLSQNFISTDFKDISSKLLDIIYSDTVPHFGCLSESVIYIRIYICDVLQSLVDFTYLPLINIHSDTPFRILYSQLKLDRPRPAYISQKRYVSNNLLEFRKEYVPKSNTHLEFTKLEIKKTDDSSV